jgi:hypothetical protein
VHTTEAFERAAGELSTAEASRARVGGALVVVLGVPLIMLLH